MVLVLRHGIELSLEFSSRVLVFSDRNRVHIDLVSEDSTREGSALDEVEDSKVLFVGHFPLKWH